MTVVVPTAILLLLLLLPTAVVGWTRPPSSPILSHARRSCSVMVNFHGHATRLSPKLRPRHHAASRLTNVVVAPPPPDPLSLLTDAQQDATVQRLAEWFTTTATAGASADGPPSQILCLTGAGLSTESGIADYRGSRGSYHRGHKPMVHDQYMKSEYQRKRYWGRGMIGWKPFDESQPNVGHTALAQLEALGSVGVSWEDDLQYFGPEDDEEDYYYGSGQRSLALITQNVDSLHRRAGTQKLVELHGNNQRVQCTSCGTYRDRNEFHRELEELNADWLATARRGVAADGLRPDGDAHVATDSFDAIRVPACQKCGGFVKPDVVFFGDTVPKHRVHLCRGAVEHARGLLVVGSSLAVHSAFRHVRAASARGIPIAIVNVGETRAEIENLPGLLKLEAPAGPTLEGLLHELHPSEATTTTSRLEDAAL